jgi:hypothetical protein
MLSLLLAHSPIESKILSNNNYILISITQRITSNSIFENSIKVTTA